MDVLWEAQRACRVLFIMDIGWALVIWAQYLGGWAFQVASVVAPGEEAT